MKRRNGYSELEIARKRDALDRVLRPDTVPLLRQRLSDAGFSRVELVADFQYGPRGLPETMHHAVFKAYK